MSPQLEFDEVVHSDGFREYTVRPARTQLLSSFDVVVLVLAGLCLGSLMLPPAAHLSALPSAAATAAAAVAATTTASLPAPSSLAAVSKGAVMPTAASRALAVGADAVPGHSSTGIEARPAAGVSSLETQSTEQDGRWTAAGHGKDAAERASQQDQQDQPRHTQLGVDSSMTIWPPWTGLQHLFRAMKEQSSELAFISSLRASWAAHRAAQAAIAAASRSHDGSASAAYPNTNTKAASGVSPSSRGMAQTHGSSDRADGHDGGMPTDTDKGAGQTRPSRASQWAAFASYMVSLVWAGLWPFLPGLEWTLSWFVSQSVRLAIAAIAALWLYNKLHQVTSESVLVFRDMGIQLRTRFLGGFASTHFIPVSKISTIIINEGITMFQVKFYLAILVLGEDRMTVAFPHTLPRLHILERVYVNVRESLMYYK